MGTKQHLSDFYLMAKEKVKQTRNHYIDGFIRDVKQIYGCFS